MNNSSISIMKNEHDEIINCNKTTTTNNNNKRKAFLKAVDKLIDTDNDLKKSKSSVDDDEFSCDLSKIIGSTIMNNQVEEVVDGAQAITKVIRRNNRIYFTDTECTYLCYGVSVFSKGNWSKILKKLNHYLNKCRPPNDLRDKYKNLEKNSTKLHKYEKKCLKIDFKNITIKGQDLDE